jgi:hypothetical protein
MAYFRDSSELSELLNGFFDSFLAAEGESVAATLADEVEAELTLRLATREPDTEILLNLSTGERLPTERASEEATLEITLDADMLHEFWLGHLNSVQLARAYERGEMHGTGPPVMLAYLAPVIAAMAPHYRRNLEECQRMDLLSIESGSGVGVWSSSLPTQEST